MCVCMCVDNHKHVRAHVRVRVHVRVYVNVWMSNADPNPNLDLEPYLALHVTPGEVDVGPILFLVVQLPLIVAVHKVSLPDHLGVN